MSNITEILEGLMTVDGAMCVALVDSQSGMLLGKAGSGMDLDVAAAATTFRRAMARFDFERSSAK
jgi:hypothetical protein